MSRQFIRRFERDALVIGGLLIGGSLAIAGVQCAAAAAGGAGLCAFGYWGLRRSVDGALSGGKRGLGTLVNFFTRYAILAAAAYVMLARLRVSPVGFAVGASWPVAAVAAAAARSFFPAGRQEHPR